MPSTAQVLSIDCVFPASYKAHSPSVPTKTALSILDSYTANYTPTGAIWIFQKPQSDSISSKSLSKSLSTILDSYPHFAGRLRMVTRQEEDPFTSKETAGYNQHDIWWGDKRSPGVAFISAASSLCVKDLLRPTASEEGNPLPIWDAEKIPKAGFLPSHPPVSAMNAPSSDDEMEYNDNINDDGDQRMQDSSCLQIQFTTLACGGFILGVAMTHILGDAITLGRFMNDWSSTHGHISRGESTLTPPSRSIFDPSLVDHVIQTVTSHAPSARSLLDRAYSLPMHRYDWFANEGAPFHSTAMDPPPAAIAAADPRLTPVSLSSGLPDPGKRPPWEEWDHDLPVRHVVLHFTRSQLRMLRSQVLEFSEKHTADEQYRDARLPSTLDVVLAHLWVCINRARGFASPSSFVEGNEAPGVNDELVFADNTIGLRGRLRYLSKSASGREANDSSATSVDKDDKSAESYDTIPAEYIGNMLAIAATGRRPGETCEPEHVPATAFALRRTIEQILGSSSITDHNGSLPTQPLQAHIFSLTQDLTPQRIWQSFLGCRHLLVSSWVRAGMYDVSFSADFGPAFVHPVMPLVDGCVEFIEAPAVFEGGECRRPGSSGKEWYRDGLDISVYLATKAMERLLADPGLHPAG